MLLCKKSSFQYCARHSQCEKRSGSLSSQYNIIWRGGSLHTWRYGGSAATIARHPNCGKPEGPVHGTNMTGIHLNGGEQCSSKYKGVLCGVELEPTKPAEAPVHQPWPRPVPKLRKFQNVLKHSIAEMAEHSLQVAVQEFKRICELKISKFKGGYLANATLIFSTWLKDIDMHVQDYGLT